MLYTWNESHLAPYAAKSAKSYGRRHNEPDHPYRAEFQRDRERIIHSRAFRRLEYKTQVFIYHEGDHYRTRLTHSIEVAQIARTISRALGINEDLAESIALAHDLGHTPFGHAGEKELNELLTDNGGFEHNHQSLRIVEELEHRYSMFNGLNLTWETREGIIKHSSPYDDPGVSEYAPDEMPSLEAQIIDLADEIAYNNHDLDDGIASGILHFKDVESLKIWGIAKKQYQGDLPSDQKRQTRDIIRTIINIQVTDLIQSTLDEISKKSIKTYKDVREADSKLVGFSSEIANANIELKVFLMENLYKHYRVARMTVKARRVIRELFDIYSIHPDTLPESFQERIDCDGLLRTATDYIAGMTDRYALEEHKKLNDPMIKV